MISFVSPVYNSAESLLILVNEIKKVTLKMGEPYEIILVDDRSPDNSWEILQQLSNEDIYIKCVRLSRNFGQHPAILAGLSLAKGDWVVVLDCDLQDQPKEVLKLWEKAKEGFDAVLAKRSVRNDGRLKRLSSLLFSKVFSFLTDTKYDNEVANFGIYSKKVVVSILQVGDYIKFFPLFVKFVGFKATALEVEHAVRPDGITSYSWKKLLRLAFNTIIAFSNKPLKLFVKFGIIISVISFLFGIYNVYLAVTGQIEVLGYSSIIVSIWFLAGIVITIMGICGIYIGKIFDQTKNRPVFIIDEVI